MISVPSAPKSASLITNQNVIRNALSSTKPKSSTPKKNQKKSSNNSRRGVTLYNDSNSSHSSGLDDSDGNIKSSTPRGQQRRSKPSSSSSTSLKQSNDTPTKSSRKNRPKSNTSTATLLEEAKQDTFTIEDLFASSAQYSSSHGGNNGNSYNTPSKHHGNSDSSKSSLSNSSPTKKRTSGNSNNTNGNFSNSNLSKKKTSSNSANNNTTVKQSQNTTTPRSRSKKTQSSAPSSGESEPDLKEILFPDLFGSNNNKNGNSTPKRFNNNDKNGNSSGKRPIPLSSEPNCFAGSSFSNSPDPSAIPRPSFMLKNGSPSSKNSSLSTELSDQETREEIKNRATIRNPDIENERSELLSLLLADSKQGQESKSEGSSPASSHSSTVSFKGLSNGVSVDLPSPPLAHAQDNAIYTSGPVANQPSPPSYPYHQAPPPRDDFGMFTASPFPIPQSRSMLPFVSSTSSLPLPPQAHTMPGYFPPPQFYGNGPMPPNYFPPEGYVNPSQHPIPVVHPTDIPPQYANNSQQPQQQGVDNFTLESDLKRILHLEKE